MNERACERCGSENRADASYCWRCYATFGGTSPPTVTAAGRIGSAAYASAGDGSVMTAPPVPAGRTPSGGEWTGWVVKVVVFLLAFVGGWWLVNHLFFSGFPFPDEVAGHERVENEDARDAAEALASIAQILNVEIEMAFYGNGATPAYTMFSFTLPDEPTLAEAQPFAAAPGNVPFQCAEEAQGASCVWGYDEETVVGIGGFGLAIEQVEPVARQVMSDLED
jgi:hypothetical protein